MTDVLAVWSQDQAISAHELKDVLNGVLGRSECVFIQLNTTQPDMIYTLINTLDCKASCVLISDRERD